MPSTAWESTGVLDGGYRRKDHNDPVAGRALPIDALALSSLLDRLEHHRVAKVEYHEAFAAETNVFLKRGRQL